MMVFLIKCNYVIVVVEWVEKRDFECGVVWIIGKICFVFCFLLYFLIWVIVFIDDINFVIVM